MADQPQKIPLSNGAHMEVYSTGGRVTSIIGHAADRHDEAAINLNDMIPQVENLRALQQVLSGIAGGGVWGFTPTASTEKYGIKPPMDMVQEQMHAALSQRLADVMAAVDETARNRINGAPPAVSAAPVVNLAESLQPNVGQAIAAMKAGLRNL